MRTFLYNHDDQFEIGPFESRSRDFAEQGVRSSILRDIGPKSAATRLIKEFQNNPQYLEELTEQEVSNITKNAKILIGKQTH